MSKLIFEKDIDFKNTNVDNIYRLFLNEYRYFDISIVY